MQKRSESNIMPRLLGAEELTTYLSLGKNNAVELARSAGALRKVGRRTLVDRVVLDSYLDALPDADE